MTPQHHLPADIERTSLSIITAELDAMVPLPIVPLDGMEVFRCRKVKLQSLSFDYDQTIGRDYRNVLFHILAFR